MTIKLTLKEFKGLVEEVTKEIVKEEEAAMEEAGFGKTISNFGKGVADSVVNAAHWATTSKKQLNKEKRQQAAKLAAWKQRQAEQQASTQQFNDERAAEQKEYQRSREARQEAERREQDRLNSPEYKRKEQERINKVKYNQRVVGGAPRGQRGSGDNGEWTQGDQDSYNQAELEKQRRQAKPDERTGVRAAWESVEHKSMSLKEFRLLVKKLVLEEIKKKSLNESEIPNDVKYYIVKASRLSTSPYTGPACQKAGVEPGKYYDSREEAEMDAKKLTSVNPVGFIVQDTSEDPFKKGEEDNDELSIPLKRLQFYQKVEEGDGVYWIDPKTGVKTGPYMVEELENVEIRQSRGFYTDAVVGLYKPQTQKHPAKRFNVKLSELEPTNDPTTDEDDPMMAGGPSDSPFPSNSNLVGPAKKRIKK